MTSVVCEGLQSCVESQPGVLRQKLSVPPKSKNSNDENECVGCDDSNIKGIDNGGWSFIQALTNPCNNAKQLPQQTDDVYVHPLVKLSASALSLKSLEMCTESLGSETGSDDIVISNEFAILLSAKEEEEFTSVSFEKKRVNQSDYGRAFNMKHNASRSFPPPLSSFIGNDVGGGGVQVRPHREGGRLVIKAVTVSSFSHTNFQADRSNGRLKLSFVKNCSFNSDNGELVKEQKEGDQEVVEFGNCDDLIGEAENEDGCCWGEEMEGIGGEMGGEAEIEELSKPSRCKENGRGSQRMSSWGPFCVAIS